MERIPVPVSLKQKKHSTFNPVAGSNYNLLDKALAAVINGRNFLIQHQQKDGHWVAELQGDTILESEFVLLMAFLGKENDEICHKCARYIQ